LNWRGADPYQHLAVFICCEFPPLDEFFFEDLQSFTIKLKLVLDRPVTHAPMLLEQSRHVFDRSKYIHRVANCIRETSPRILDDPYSVDIWGPRRERTGKINLLR
jgi:hypothetical protein